MKQISTTSIRLMMLSVVAVIIAVSFSATVHAQTDTKTVTVVQKLSYSAVDAIKDAATAAGIVAIVGQPMKIPIAVVQGMAMNKAFQWIGKIMKTVQICRAFQLWANSCGGRETSTIINVEIILDGGSDPKPRIVIPFTARNLGPKGNGYHGYCAPNDAAGNPVMKLDVFGDGSVILDAIRCNMD